MVDFNALTLLGRYIAMVVAGVSAVGTMGTLYLIYDMHCWNAYMKLIFHLTLCQFLSDIAFFIAPWHSENLILFQVQVFIYTLGSVSVALWTNLISCSLFSVVIWQKNLNFGDYFGVLSCAILIPGLLMGIFYAMLVNSNFNTVKSALVWAQLLSITFNVIIHTRVSIALVHMGIKLRDDAQRMAGVVNSANDSSVPLLSVDEVQCKMNIYEPIRELARRLKYYPVVQIFAILGQCWYFFGYNLKLLGPSSHDATLRLIAWYMYSILTPSAGIGYFIVFLKVQPHAYNHLCNRVRLALSLPIKTRSLSFQSESYHEPDTTFNRVRDDPPSRFRTAGSFDSASSGATLTSHTTGGDSSHITVGSSGGGNVASMDEETLMRRIRELRRANLRLNYPLQPNDRDRSKEAVVDGQRTIDESYL